MLKSLANELLSERLLAEDDAVVVGVSGGADSMALLNLLSELNARLGWRLRIHVAHFNHMLRGDEADKDAAFVASAADGLALPCTMEQADIAALAAAEGGGLEEIARRERYAFLHRVCLRADARRLAVGHHADDNAETVLHRVLRGTGLRGLAGIPRQRRLAPADDTRIIRPLLRHTRAEIRAYLADAGVAYREDRTNDSPEPMRNRLRHVVLPLVEREVNPQARDALLRLAEQAVWLEEFLRETVQRTFETLIVSHTDQELVLNADALARKSRIVQTEIVRLAYQSFGLGEQELSFAHLVSALDLIADPASGRQARLPGGMSIEKRYGRLLFSLPSPEPRESVAEEVAVHVPGRTSLAVRRLAIECTIEEVAPDDIPRLRASAGRYEEFLDGDAVAMPLTIRGPRRGERFTPLGAPGTKKVSEFLIDNKVEPRERERTAVLCDRLGLVWLIGHRIDDRVKLTGLTRRVLHLRVRMLDG